MILKTLRCKKPNHFSRLVKYVLSEQSQEGLDKGDSFMIVRNIRSVETEGIIKAFTANDVFRKKRKNGVAMYHEILSWHEDDTEYLTIKGMQDMANHYISLRGENALCLAVPHFDQSHWHVHFLFSGTEYKSDKTLRMDNKRFETIRRNIEGYQIEKYPELQRSIVHTNKPKKERKNSITADKNSRKERAYQAKRRGKRTLDKEHLANVVAQKLANAQKEQQFLASLEQEEGIELYTYRGKIKGIIFNDRKYRFSTLGIDKMQLQVHRKREPEVERRLAELEKLRQQKIRGRDKDKNLGRG